MSHARLSPGTSAIRGRFRVSSESRHGGGSAGCGTLGGSLWFAGWLFTVGYLGLHFWRAVLALVVWPYFLGVALK
jgi:hypothetical protein